MTETDDVFASTVDYYARYRTDYPTDRLDWLAREIGLDGDSLLLDVGCGPGQIAVPMARLCGRVTAIDPVASMLYHGRAAAAVAGASTITWRQGHSRDLARLVEPGAQAAIFAASFHWTDREAVLQVLDDLLRPGGSVVIITDALEDDSAPDWDQAIGEIRARYLGDGVPDLDEHLHPKRADREILAESPFSVVETHMWAWDRALTVDEVVGLQFSYSFSSPALFGDQQDAFAAEARAAVLGLHPSGIVTEPLRNEVLIATRPR